MKKLAVLIALLIALSPSALALRLTGVDIERPAFPWGAYTLELSLYTDDPAEVDYAPYPAEGRLVMVRLTSLEGQIALSDIESGADRFELRDASGAAHAPEGWRVRGVSFTNGEFKASPAQGAFELIFHLPDGVSPGGAALGVGGAGAGERVVVQMPGATPEAAGTPEAPEPAAKPEAAAGTPEPSALPEPAAEPEAAAGTPEPTAEPEPDAAPFLSDLLRAQAEKASDPWTRAVLESGPEDILSEDGALKFTLRSFDPRLKELGDYGADKAAYLDALIENASRHDLKLTLKVTLEDGRWTASAAAVKAMVKAASKAAAAAKKAFNDKKARIALSDYLLGERGAAEFAADADPLSLAPLFAAQSKQSLSVADGPHALKLTTVGAKVETLLEKGYDAALQRLARQQGVSALPGGEIERAFLDELTAQAAALKKKGAEKAEFILDLDALGAPAGRRSAGDAYPQFLSAYAEAYSDMAAALYVKVVNLPDTPAVDYPKSGRLSGSSGGTKVILKVPKDGDARYVQLRSVDTDETSVSAFIRPGQSATVRVPKGDYYLLVAAGTLWFGEEELFGDDGDYMRTEETEILSSRYYHTITLGGVTDGNMSSYDSDPSEFR